MSVISPFGVGTRAFTDGFQAGVPALTRVPAEDDVPHTSAGVVTGFDYGTMEPGQKNLRSLGRAGGLAAGAVALVLREHDLDDLTAAERGIVLGGDLITTDMAMAIMRDSLTQAAPYHVNAKLFPGSVMNHPAAQCAIRYDFKGPNSTVTSGRVSALSVLNYARRMHKAGRAQVLLAGAVEDLNAKRSWLRWHGHGEQSSKPLGEGVCLFLTESLDSALDHGRTPVAEVLALEFGVASRPGSLPEVLGARIRAALRRAGVAARDVVFAAPSGDDGDDEHTVVTAELHEDVQVLYPQRLIGDTDGASGAFQLAAAIASAKDSAAVALVTSVDPDGQVGCGVFRIMPGRSRSHQ